jgi:AcrR family transcriptional regulator
MPEVNQGLPGVNQGLPGVHQGQTVVAEPSRTYAGRTGAERVARRRRALARAAFELVAQDGWAQLRIDRICQAARLNKRYFYESFSDLDAIIEAVMNGLAKELISVTIAAMDPDTPRRKLIRDGIAALVHHLTDDPRRALVLFGESAGSEAIARHRAAALQQTARAAVAQGRSVHILEEAESDSIIDVLGALLIGGTRHAVLDWLHGRVECDLEQFIDDLATLWLVAAEGAVACARERR